MNHEPIVETGDEDTMFPSLKIEVNDEEIQLTYSQAKILWTKLGKCLRDIKPDDFAM